MKRLYFAVTKRCNLRCMHCFNSSGDAKSDELSFDEVRAVIDMAHGDNMEEVQLTGGEALMRDDIFKIIDYIHSKGMSILLQTNGALNESVLHKLTGLNRQLTGFIISMDGLETNTAFRGQAVTDMAIRTIETLAVHFPIRINALLSARISDEEIFRLIGLSVKTGAKLAFNPIIPLGRGSISDMNELNEFFCRMMWIQKVGFGIRKSFEYDTNTGLFSENENCPVRRKSAIFVSSNGDCYTCGFFEGVPDMRLGNLIKQKGGFKGMIDKYPDKCGNINSECATCDHYIEKRCFAGCPARIYAICGNLNGREYYCMKQFTTNCQESRKGD